jgi:hypothetical protein
MVVTASARPLLYNCLVAYNSANSTGGMNCRILVVE